MSTAPRARMNAAPPDQHRRPDREQHSDRDVDDVLDEDQRPVAEADVRRRLLVGLRHTAIMPVSWG
ncbi:MAG: hypothetical protein M3P31_04925 [Actinomycetota bacterium]|nr:hypothetical protein [Actinomycetota bacterium]